MARTEFLRHAKARARSVIALVNHGSRKTALFKERDPILAATAIGVFPNLYKDGRRVGRPGQREQRQCGDTGKPSAACVADAVVLSGHRTLVVKSPVYFLPTLTWPFMPAS
jgi:hypothetical protein